MKLFIQEYYCVSSVVAHNAVPTSSLHQHKFIFFIQTRKALEVTLPVYYRCRKKHANSCYGDHTKSITPPYLYKRRKGKNRGT